MGVLQVVPESVLQQHEARTAAAKAEAEKAAKTPDIAMTNLAAHIRSQFEIMKTHRNNQAAGWSHRLTSALRAFNGQYDPEKLAAIKKFGGSEVYARVIAMKCRGASALLRDVYLAPDRPWGITPPADPDVPASIITSIKQLVESELNSNDALGGDAVPPETIRDRMFQLFNAARQAAKKRAADQAKIAEEKIDELLTEGGFYKAMAEFIIDLPLFPFACIKGPVVRIVPTVEWENGVAVIKQTARLFWNRTSPFDIWWTPGAAEIEDASVIERSRVTRGDLNDLLDLPGYNHDAIRKVLDEYGRGGLNDDWDSTDSERATQENRENPMMNRSGMISCLEWHGNIQGRMLIDYGMKKGTGPNEVGDELRDYMVQAWLIGPHVIKAQMSPSPRKRHPYYITSFEKVPGTPLGNGLPDILNDIADVCNASLRALVNNLSIASGPQVVVNTDRLAPDEDAEDMYPWKKWHMISDPLGNNSQVPVSFFQPVSNAQELLTVYKEFNAIADDISAIPKYLSGGGAGGAGRTASGLAMLMGNASKILQTVAANIDRDVVGPALAGLHDMLMLTDTSGMLTGEESVKVLGVNVAIQRETMRSRQLEFLTATANPIDAQIMGPKGRSVVLRSVADGIGILGEEIIPSDEALAEIKQQQDDARSAEMLGAAAQGGKKSRGSTDDMGPRTTVSGGMH